MLTTLTFMLQHLAFVVIVLVFHHDTRILPNWLVGLWLVVWNFVYFSTYASARQNILDLDIEIDAIIEYMLLRFPFLMPLFSLGFTFTYFALLAGILLSFFSAYSILFTYHLIFCIIFLYGLLHLTLPNEQ